MNIKATLSEFIKLNVNVIDDSASKNRSLNELKSTWGSRFIRVATESLKRKEMDLDYENVDWSELNELVISKVSSTAEQTIRRMRIESTCEAFRQETEDFARDIRKRQLERNNFEGQSSKKKVKIYIYIKQLYAKYSYLNTDCSGTDKHSGRRK